MTNSIGSCRSAFLGVTGEVVILSGSNTNPWISVLYYHGHGTKLDQNWQRGVLQKPQPLNFFCGRKQNLQLLPLTATKY